MREYTFLCQKCRKEIDVDCTCEEAFKRAKSQGLRPPTKALVEQRDGSFKWEVRQ